MKKLSQEDIDSIYDVLLLIIMGSLWIGASLIILALSIRLVMDIF